MLKSKIDPDGWSSFWWPAGIALLIFGLIVFFAVLETKHAVRQIETNVNKRFDHIQPTQAYVPKYDSITQDRLDTIEAHRKMSHSHVDNMYNGELQNVLDSLYNE